MKKSTKNLHRGFTIAELLIAMLVVMVVLAALVPIIGPKKMKYILNSRNGHGIYECYYVYDSNDEKYHLFEYSVVDGHESLPEEITGETECTVPAIPNAKYTIYAIGAGGGYEESAEGNASLDFFNMLRDAENGGAFQLNATGNQLFEDPQEVHLQTFQRDIAAANNNPEHLFGLANMIRTAINDARPAFVFRNIQSPTGQSGFSMSSGVRTRPDCIGGDYQEVIVLNPNDSFGLENLDFNSLENCFVNIFKRGMSSAEGAVYEGDLFVPITANANFSGLPRSGTTYSCNQGEHLNASGRCQYTIGFNNGEGDVTLTITGSMSPQDAGCTEPKWDNNTKRFPANSGCDNLYSEDQQGSIRATQNVFTDNAYTTLFNGVTGGGQPNQAPANEGIGMSRTNSEGTEGSVEYEGAEGLAFQWQYFRLGANISYIPTARPGETKIGHGKFTGELILCPASQNGSRTTVVNRTSVGDKEIVISPENGADTNIEPYSSRYDISANVPFPPQEIMDSINIDNAGLRYIDIIRGSAGASENNPLFNCDNTEGDRYANCPGLGAMGYYPLLSKGYLDMINGLEDVAQEAQFKPHIEFINGAIQFNGGQRFAIDMQYNTDYNYYEGNTPQCPAGTEALRNIDGILIACSSRNQIRGLGAVILVW